MIEIVYTDDDGSQRKGPELDGAGSWLVPDVYFVFVGSGGMKPGYIKTIMYLMMASVVYNDFITNERHGL